MSRLDLIHADSWFRRSRAALLEQIPCKRGCCRCCIGPFAITIADVATLQEGLAHLDPHTRQDITRRAREQVRAMESAYPRLGRSQALDDWEDWEQDSVVERFAALPCPALGDDGSCRVYAFRPMTCRMMGIPTCEKDGISQGACELQIALPVVPLPQALRQEEDRLAEEEANAIEAERTDQAGGTEVFVAYGFLPPRS
jgi:Fe-S-cluster containining protein